MFCSSCGEKIVEAGLFYHKCGSAVSSGCNPENIVNNENSGSTSSRREHGGKMPCRLPSDSGPPIMTFNEFRKVKEKDRQGHFKNSTSTKRKVDENKDSHKAKIVTIKVGVMTYGEDCRELTLTFMIVTFSTAL